jgi:hypothetical protein
MKKTILFLVIILFAGFSQNIFAQLNDVSDDNYKFQIGIPFGWNNSKGDETDKKDAISYSFKSTDGKLTVMLLAFKKTTVQNLADLIYTVEKDVNLNIPKRVSEYFDYDFGDYDGRSAKYQNDNFVEKVFYYRTKYTESNSNYAYVIRFISLPSFYNSDLESEIQTISNSFKIIK